MNDEKLILYYYEDGLSTTERHEIETAMRRDPGLARRYVALTRDLDAMRTAPDVPAPEGLHYRLQSTIQRAARLEEDAQPRPDGRLHRWSFALGAAFSAVLAVGIGIGLWMAGDEPGNLPKPVQTTPVVATNWSTAAFERGLESHFRSGRRELASIGGDSVSDRAALVASLLEQNRLYARLALQNDAPDLARVLRSFEPILNQLGREDLSDEDAAALQAQLEFEFGVMLTKLARATSQQTGPDKQEI